MARSSRAPTKPRTRITALERYLLFSSGLILVAISPVVSLNRFAPIKLTFLGVFGAISMVVIVNTYRRGAQFSRGFVITNISFAATLTLSFLVHPDNRTHQIYGDSQRYVGLLSYLILVFVAVAASTLGAQALQHFFLRMMFGAGLLVQIYAVLQVVGLDPIKWNNEKNWIVSFLGNPNHLSALMGVLFWISIYCFARDTSRARFFYLANSLLVLFVLWKADSLQGFVILFVGLIVISTVFLSRQKLPRVSLTILGGFLITGCLQVILGLGGRGLIASTFSEGTFARRIDLWSAGISMAKESPLLGSGIGSYRTLFPAFRSPESVARTSIWRLSDTAHNEFVDLLVSGGALLLISYLAIITCVLVIAIGKVIDLSKTSKTPIFQPILLIFIIWLGALIHNLVSPPSLSLSYLFAFTGGLLVATDRISGGPMIQRRDIKAGIPLVGVLATTSVIMSALPYINESSVVSAGKNGNSDRVLLLVDNFPQDPVRTIYVSRTLAQRGQTAAAIEVIKVSLLEFPESIKLLKLILRLPISKEDRNEYRARLIELNPFKNQK